MVGIMSMSITAVTNIAVQPVHIHLLQMFITLNRALGAIIHLLNTGGNVLFVVSMYMGITYFPEASALFAIGQTNFLKIK